MCWNKKNRYDVKSCLFGNKNKESYSVYPNENGIEVMLVLVLG